MKTPLQLRVAHICTIAALLAVALAVEGCAGKSKTVNRKKAIVLGRGFPITDPDGSPSHAEKARINFLRLVDNEDNNPKEGWTADLSYDVLVKLGLDPTNTAPAALFEALGRKRLGYRIAIQNLAVGASRPYWADALENGMMGFAPQGNNNPGLRIPDGLGLYAAVSVAGGVTQNQSSFGPGVEFIDALPNGDAAQSWANQVVAAKFAKLLDENPKYNIWDARAHLRQSASNWEAGWNENTGYGRPNLDTPIDKLVPQPPVAFKVNVSPDRRQVEFSWINFKQRGFDATAIARGDGSIIYSGKGDRFLWNSDTNGSETFTYWSKNKAGETSRIESYQNRTVTNLVSSPM